MVPMSSLSADFTVPQGLKVGLLGLGRYGQQPIPYILDTDLADTIHIRYDTDVHYLRFQ